MEALVELTKSTGNRLLFDLNLQLRFGQQWDPSNAIELLEFFASRGYGDNIDLELGNGLRLFLVVIDHNLLYNEFCVIYNIAYILYTAYILYNLIFFCLTALPYLD